MQTTSRGYQYPEALIDAPNGPAQIQQVAQRANEEWGTVAAVVNLPATDPTKTGRRRYVTGTGDEYVDIGTGWVKTGSVNYAPINAPSFTGNPTVQNTLLFGVAGDTNLYRFAANVLKTDDAFVGAAGAAFSGAYVPSTGSNVEIGTTGTPVGFIQAFNRTTSAAIPLNLSGSAVNVFVGPQVLGVNAAGKTALTLADTGAQTSGITIGGDTNLYRSAADSLKTDDTLRSSLDQVARDGAASQVTSGAVSGNAGFLFGSASDANFYRLAASSLKTDGVLRALQFHVDAATNAAFRGNQIAANIFIANNLLSTDANNAFRISGNGKTEWGPGGATAVDTNLYRSAAAVLKTDGSFSAGPITASAAGGGGQAGVIFDNAGLISAVRTAAGNVFSAGLTVDTQRRLAINTDGTLTWGTGALAGDTNLYRGTADQLKTDDNLSVALNLYVDQGAGSAKVFFGSALDTNLYRSAADSLKTDDTLRSAFNTIARDTAASQIVIGTAGPSSEAGVLFGSAGDTVLYRSTTDTLRTGDNLIVDLNLTVTGTVNGRKVLASPYFRAFKSADLAGVATGAVILFDTETDPNGWYDPATGRFQPTVAGRYRISWSIGALPLGADDRALSSFVRMNGAGASVSTGSTEYQRGTAGSPRSLTSQGTDTIAMNGTTDYLEVIANHDGTFTATINGTTGRTRFEAEYIGA